MKYLIRLMVAVCLLAATINIAHAQDVMQSIMDANAQTQYTYMTGQINKDVMANMYKNKNGVTGSSKTFTYYIMPYFTGDVVKQVGARMKLSQPVINKLINYDFNTAFRTLTKGFNLQYNDVADIVTAYQVQSWLIANSATADPSPKAVYAVRNQVRKSLSANAQITGNGKTRAQLGEELKILFALGNAGWQGARQQGKLKVYSDAVAQNYQQQYHQDLRSLKLDDNGMHP